MVDVGKAVSVQAKFEFVSQEQKKPKLKNVTVTAINSGEESKQTVKELSFLPRSIAEEVLIFSKTSPNGQTVNVISREGWGADEDLRFKDGKEDWPRSYHGTRKLVIHHTAGAGSNGETDLEKNKEAVRGIYAYHAVTLGWGDIGLTRWLTQWAMSMRDVMARMNLLSAPTQQQIR